MHRLLSHPKKHRLLPRWDLWPTAHCQPKLLKFLRKRLRAMRVGKDAHDDTWKRKRKERQKWCKDNPYKDR